MNDFEVESYKNGDNFVDDFSNEYAEPDEVDDDSESLNFEETLAEFAAFNELDANVNEDYKSKKNVQTVETALNVKEAINQEKIEHNETTYAPTFTSAVSPQSDSLDEEYGI